MMVVLDINNRFIEETVSSSNNSPVIVRDVLDAYQKQKPGKAIGYGGIPMEALMYNGPTLTVHICFLFNLFVKIWICTTAFMQSVAIPLCKSGVLSLSDLNDYRPIAISTSFPKLFESIVASHFVSSGSTGMHQFGFKKDTQLRCALMC